MSARPRSRRLRRSGPTLRSKSPKNPRPLGAIVPVGLGGEATLPMNSVVTKELKVCGAFRTGVEFGWAVDLISNRRVDMRPLLTASYPVEQAVEAFQFAADKSRAMKVQINFAGVQ